MDCQSILFFSYFHQLIQNALSESPSDLSKLDAEIDRRVFREAVPPVKRKDSYKIGYKYGLPGIYAKKSPKGFEIPLGDFYIASAAL